MHVSSKEREIAVASITIHSLEFLPVIAIAKRGKLTRIMGPILIVPRIGGGESDNGTIDPIG